MNYRKKIFIILVSLVIAGAMLIQPGCSGKDPAVIAAEVAAEWGVGNIGSVSKSIAGLAASDSPLFKTVIAKTIEKDINDQISWKYSEPRMSSEDRYEVVATAYTNVDLSIMGMYTVSVGYDLLIDTANKEVVTADMDPGSFAMVKQ
jgi:hypothetical protein